MSEIRTCLKSELFSGFQTTVRKLDVFKQMFLGCPKSGQVRFLGTYCTHLTTLPARRYPTTVPPARQWKQRKFRSSFWLLPNLRQFEVHQLVVRVAAWRRWLCPRDCGRPRSWTSSCLLSCKETKPRGRFDKMFQNLVLNTNKTGFKIAVRTLNRVIVVFYNVTYYPKIKYRK